MTTPAGRAPEEPGASKTRARPTPSPRPSQAPPTDPRRLAGYGPPPASTLGAPAYALRVRRRQKELKVAIAEIEGRLRKAEAERDGAEAQLGQAAVDYGLVSEASDDADKLTSRVAEAERSIAQAKGRQSQQKEYFEAEKQRKQAEIQALEERLAPVRQKIGEFEERLKAAAEEKRRAEATTKRLEIEARNAAATSDLARQRSIEEQRVASAGAVAAKEQEAEQLKYGMDVLAQKTREDELKLNALKTELGQFSAFAAERVGDTGEREKLAAVWRRSRLAVIGRRVYDMEQRPQLLDGDRLLGRIDQSRKKVTEVQQELGPYLEALDAYDRDSVRKALYLAIGCGVLFLVLLGVLFATC